MYSKVNFSFLFLYTISPFHIISKVTYRVLIWRETLTGYLCPSLSDQHGTKAFIIVLLNAIEARRRGLSL